MQVSTRRRTLQLSKLIHGRNQTLFSMAGYRTYATAKEVKDFDVVVVGGGPVGLALTCALVSPMKLSRSDRNLKHSPLSIALIEASDLSRVRAWDPENDGDGFNYSNRVSSITNASRSFLQDIGAWRHVDETRTSPIEEMQVWDGISDSRIEFSATSIGGAEMARLIENLNLQRALLRQIEENTLAKQGEFSLIDKTKVLSIEPDSRNGWPLLQLSNSETIRARLLVGADGPSSPVRAYSNIDTYGWAYNARGVVATLRHPATLTSFGTERNYTTAYQRFLPTGPIAFLPIGPTTASLVWSTTPELAQALVDAGEEVLTLMINAAFRLPDVSLGYLHRFLLERWSQSVEKRGFVDVKEIEEEIRWRELSHNISSESVLASTSMEVEKGIPAPDADMYPPLVRAVQPKSAAYFPLRMAHAESYMGKRTVLVGDAAHTTHPLAGQGLNLGLADVECLSNTIQQSAATGTDIGSHIALEAYPRERYFANHILLSAVDKLAKLYGTRLGPIVWLRSTGIETINEIGSIKDLFMGIAGAGVRPHGEITEKGMNRDKNDWTTIAAAAAQQIGTALDGARALFGSVAGGRRH